jgi:hypothetical protein
VSATEFKSLFRIQSCVNAAIHDPGSAFTRVGVIEIAAGLLVAVKPRLGSHVVAAWLGGIIVNLLLARGFYDIALRDFGLSLGALALGQLSRDYGPSKRTRE